jgi:hypothetical protein
MGRLVDLRPRLPIFGPPSSHRPSSRSGPSRRAPPARAAGRGMVTMQSTVRLPDRQRASDNRDSMVNARRRGDIGLSPHRSAIAFVSPFSALM